MRVADAGPERKLRKALLRCVLRAAQLSAEKRNENATALQRLRSRSSVRLRTLQPVRRKHAKNEANKKAGKGKENF